MGSGAPRRSPPRRKTAKPARQSAAKPARHATAAPLITEDDLRRLVYEHANTLAPADVEDLLGQESTLRERAATLDGARGDLLRAQLDLALACLYDHDAGRIPQIPYFTISLLAAGLAYLVDELDIIPDFIPKIGTLDDALVMAMAFHLAEDGIRRYCTFKEIDPTPVIGVVHHVAHRPTARGRRKG